MTIIISDDCRPRCVPHDTTLEVARMQFAVLSRMTPAERLVRGCRMNDDARKLVRDGVRHRHPEYDDNQIRQAVIRLLLGEEWFKTCFPGCDVKP